MASIDHIVILMMENRSFDHYLGALNLPPENRTDIEGLAKAPAGIPGPRGATYKPWRMDGVDPGYDDPPHGWGPAHNDYNGGLNDQFIFEYYAAYKKTRTTFDQLKFPVGYYTRETLPVLYKLADQFCVCDHWFGSVLSSTWPNRKYLHSGKRDDDDDTQTVPGIPGFRTKPFYEVFEEHSNPVTKEKLTWKSYFSDLPFLGFWYPFAITHAFSHFRLIREFVRDCQDGTLPSLSIVDPPFTVADDHPSHDPKLGEKFIGLIVDAVTNSKNWENTALIILYDENGGFYDHVPPPLSGDALPDDRLGFRVPAIVVSPYAKRGFACHTDFDHTAVMKAIDDRWSINFDPRDFGTRFTRAASIWDECFDFTQTPLPKGEYTGEPVMAAMSWSSGVHERIAMPPHLFEGLLERIFILPGLKQLDKRAAVYESLSLFEEDVVALKRMVRDMGI